MNKESLKKMVEDVDCVKVVSALFQAIAYQETVKAVIEPKQKEVLARHQFKIAKKYARKDPNRVILDSNSLYLVEDADFQIYLTEMDQFHTDKGFKKPDRNYCPLLMAENMVREVKIEVADFLEPYIGISYDDISYSLKSYKKYFDLILGLFAHKVERHITETA